MALVFARHYRTPYSTCADECNEKTNTFTASLLGNPNPGSSASDPGSGASPLPRSQAELGNQRRLNIAYHVIPAGRCRDPVPGTVTGFGCGLGRAKYSVDTLFGFGSDSNICVVAVALRLRLSQGGNRAPGAFRKSPPRYGASGKEWVNISPAWARVFSVISTPPSILAISRTRSSPVRAVSAVFVESSATCFCTFTW
uniref:Uncharacterized protein n=1 Tax=Candidatus Kentrum sp. DK TaxID=2126562 RepID=A0A450RUI0_9GAMM|nr:MAG: hypothetical protein BECKDK2373B_GA0170837_100319 [Candidatus Kentron sp. DK]